MAQSSQAQPHCICRAGLLTDQRKWLAVDCSR